MSKNHYKTTERSFYEEGILVKKIFYDKQEKIRKRIIYSDERITTSYYKNSKLTKSFFKIRKRKIQKEYDVSYGKIDKLNDYKKYRDIRTNFRFFYHTGYGKYKEGQKTINGNLPKYMREGYRSLEDCKNKSQFHLTMEIITESNYAWRGGWVYTLYQSGNYKVPVFRMTGFY
jgi:hypothetical protein